MKNNLFIVCTPFNLLTVFILAKSIFKDDNNYLAVMHPQSYEEWSKEPVLNYILSGKSGFKEIFLLLRWFRTGQGSYKKQIENLKDMLGDINFDRVFLAVDLDEQAQLLVAILGKKEFYRYEDGIGSYSYNFYNRSRPRAFFHSLKFKYVCQKAGIKTDLEFNSKKIGASKAAVQDYIYRPELLLRQSPEVVEITSEMIKNAIKEIKENDLLVSFFNKPAILYLSQPIKRSRKEEREEICLLRDIIESLDENTDFIYKPHARDKTDKLARYKKAIPNLKVFNSRTPAEILYISEPNLQMVIAYYSSALLYGEKFTGRKIRMLSYAKESGKKHICEALEVMKKAGVEFLTEKQQIIGERTKKNRTMA